MENLKWGVIITRLRGTVTVKPRTKPRALDCQTFISITILKHLSNTCTAHLKTVQRGKEEESKEQAKKGMRALPM